MKLSKFYGMKATSSLPNSLKTSLMETDSISNTSWQKPNIFLFFPVVNLAGIMTELIINPKYSIS